MFSGDQIQLTDACDVMMIEIKFDKCVSVFGDAFLLIAHQFWDHDDDDAFLKFQNGVKFYICVVYGRCYLLLVWCQLSRKINYYFQVVIFQICRWMILMMRGMYDFIHPKFT